MWSTFNAPNRFIDKICHVLCSCKKTLRFYSRNGKGIAQHRGGFTRLLSTKSDATNHIIQTHTQKIWENSTNNCTLCIFLIVYAKTWLKTPEIHETLQNGVNKLAFD